MNRRVRLGAVDYLNARPLVHGLDQQSELFELRFDPPSLCAELLHADAIDIGMIPSIEFWRGAEYAVVPGIGIISNGPVASVALFTRKPLAELRTIAADTSSRTSNALLRVLCAERFNMAPEFVPMAPDATRMLRECDAALIIGDPALYFESPAADVTKIDLGEEWTALTGLPFVWAFWAGRPHVVSPDVVAALTDARNAGVAASDQIADEYCGPSRAALGRAYLKDNIQYVLGSREEAGLRRFYELSEQHGLIDTSNHDLQVGASEVGS
jgi:chorismate dehydratase